MPIIKGVTTKSSESIWKSPDGQRELYKVDFEYEGKPFSAKSYSTTIINPGWTGDLLIEERQGKQGLETFAKQAPKEDDGYRGSNSTTGNSSKSSYVPKDEKAIQAMWAIGQSIAAHNGANELDVADLASVEALAVEVFGMVDRVKGEASTDTTAPEPSKPAEQVDDVVIEDVDEPLDLSGIDDILGGGTEVIETGEQPWQPKS